ncbi:MAG: hypothetical protein JST92_14215, partial [Deltaproteobacteria bacterium]|nr:hypothetical protein [Deltaproteobacteria bacterium]
TQPPAQTGHGHGHGRPAPLPTVNSRPNRTSALRTTLSWLRREFFTPALPPIAGLDTMDHTGLVRELLNLFAGDTANVIPDWQRYMLLHYTGLRYNLSADLTHPGQHDAAYTYTRETNLIEGLRDEEIAAEVAALTDARRLEVLQELQRFADGPLGDALRDALSHDAPHPPTDHPSSAWTERAPLFRRAGVIAGSGNAPLGDTAGQLVFNQFTRPASEQQSDNPDAVRARLHLVLRALVRTGLGHDLDDDACLGLLDARRLLQRPASVPYWTAVVRQCLLRLDVTDDNWETPQRASESLERALIRDRGREDWNIRQNRDLTITPRHAVCNQIVEMTSAARGAVIPGGFFRAANACPAIPDPSGSGANVQLFHASLSTTPALTPGWLIFFLCWSPWTANLRFDVDSHFAAGPGTHLGPDTMMGGNITLGTGPYPQETAGTRGTLMNSSTFASVHLSEMTAPPAGVLETAGLGTIGKIIDGPTQFIVRKPTGASSYCFYLKAFHGSLLWRATSSTLFTYETNAPTQLTRRPNNGAWNVYFSQPVARRQQAANLARFLPPATGAQAWIDAALSAPQYDPDAGT